MNAIVVIVFFLLTVLTLTLFINWLDNKIGR